ncbi:MAG: GTPase/DUF3482 domain-containing protein [Verrucomicrobiaceae bacterium]
MSEVNTEVPTFAVVGKINMGKSSVLATLLEIDDDSVVRVSATPGATTHCQDLPVKYEGREMIRFVDTPGFSNALEAMRAIQTLHGEGTPDLATIKAFVEGQGQDGEFEDEARLLRPLIDGAGVLYVIDPSKPLRDTFVAEMEILRWTGRPRMALLNEKESDPEREKEWRTRLGSYFNLVRTFNAHRARFEERKRLLKSLLEIDEHNRQRIEETIELIEYEWSQRREESAEHLMAFLEKALAHRESVALDETEEQIESKKERKRKELTRKYYGAIAKLEEGTYRKILRLYRHQSIMVDVDEELFNGLDLSSEETWQKWGLSKGQLTLAGGVAGGAAGIAVDLGSGGLTHGLGTLFGAIGGASAAFFKGEDLPDLKMGMTGGKGSKRALIMGPPASQNFPWILLDRALHHYREIISRSHGKREGELAAHEEDAGWVRAFSRERRVKLQKWFTSRSKKASDFDSEVYGVFVECLHEVENGSD